MKMIRNFLDDYRYLTHRLKHLSCQIFGANWRICVPGMSAGRLLDLCVPGMSAGRLFDLCLSVSGNSAGTRSGISAES